MNIKQVRERWSLEGLLGELGFTPDRKKSRGHDLWYNSPFRPDEKESSFHINTRDDIWKDFGLVGDLSGGDIIAFAQRYLQEQGKASTVRDALAWFRTHPGGSISQSRAIQRSDHQPKKEDRTFRLLSVKAIYTNALIEYLEERHIPFSIANQFLKQVYFQHPSTQKKFYGLGFKNRSGGYDVRNPIGFKGVIGKKDLSVVEGASSSTHVDVYEGAFDFLSRMALDARAEKSLPTNDSIIMHSNTMYEAAAAHIRERKYQKLVLWLDNDEAGEKGRVALINELDGYPIQVEARNNIYEGYKDVNEWLVATQSPS